MSIPKVARYSKPSLRISTALSNFKACSTKHSISAMVSERIIHLISGKRVELILKRRIPKPASNKTATGSDAISPHRLRASLYSLALVTIRFNS